VALPSPGEDALYDVLGFGFGSDVSECEVVNGGCLALEERSQGVGIALPEALAKQREGSGQRRIWVGHIRALMDGCSSARSSQPLLTANVSAVAKTRPAAR
jgi:hypothetical protein